MFKLGQWVEADNGYGVIERIFSEYYQFGDDFIPTDKHIGDKKQDVMVVKRFCSFDFKVFPQTRVVSERLIRSIDEEIMDDIYDLLEVHKNLKRFKNYKVKTDFDEILNVDIYFSDEDKEKFERALNEFLSNYELFTVRELQDHLGIDNIFNAKAGPTPNYYLQLGSNGLGSYNENREMIFRRARLVKK